MAEINEVFGSECLPINLPAPGNGDVVDCFFNPQGEAAFSSVSDAHTAIIDQVVEMDEDLMALYLEQGEDLAPEQLHDPFEQAMREGHLVPVAFVSATTGTGVDALLDLFVRLMPNPLEGNPRPFVKGFGEEARITSYNVCYTKLLRVVEGGHQVRPADPLTLRRQHDAVAARDVGAAVDLAHARVDGRQHPRRTQIHQRPLGQGRQGGDRHHREVRREGDALGHAGGDAHAGEAAGAAAERQSVEGAHRERNNFV